MALKETCDSRMLIEQGKRKTMPSGTVKWFNATKGFGFIEPSDGGSDAFVHVTAVQRAGLDGLREGQKVEYELIPGNNGKEAADNLVALD
jgi:CspA family cold shock protein